MASKRASQTKKERKKTQIGVSIILLMVANRWEICYISEPQSKEDKKGGESVKKANKRSRGKTRGPT